MTARIVLTTAALLLATTPASAELTMTIDAQPEAPILPEIETGTIGGTLTLDCQTLLEFAPLGSTSVAVTMTTNAPAGVTATGQTSHTLDGQSCVGPGFQGAVSSTFQFQVAVSRDVRGLEPLAIGFGAEVSSQSPLGSDPPSATAGATVVAGYYSLLQAKLDNKLVTTATGEADVAVELTNFGNAATIVSVTLSQDSADGATFPATVELGAGGADDAVGVVPVQVSVGSSSAQYSYSLTFTPAAKADPTFVGNDVGVTLAVRVQPEDQGAPGLGPVAGLAAVGAALWLRRRP